MCATNWSAFSVSHGHRRPRGVGRSCRGSEMGTDVDALFKLPLGEFTSERHALAARLKKAGQQTEAAEAKALAKPSVSAWVVNQLYWRHGYLFGRLIDAGERLRHAQTTQQTSSPARELVNARREVVAALMTTAADILREGGYSDTRDVMRRVTSTLEALSAYGSLTGAPSAGRPHRRHLHARARQLRGL